MRYIKKVLINISSIVFLLWFFIFPSKVALAATPDQDTWQFSSASNFDISNSSRVTFSNNSVKLLPTDFVSGGYQTWHDSHTGGVGTSRGWDIVVSSDRNYIYFGGTTASDTGSNGFGYIVKADQNLNEIWYQTYVEGSSPYHGIQEIELDSNGDLVAVGEYEAGGATYFRIMKINPNDGSVIWSDIQDRGNAWVDVWGDGALALDDSDNIFYTHLSGLNNPGASPVEIYKYNTNGTLLWHQTDDINGASYPYHEDLWQAGTDSEGSIYFSSGVSSGGGSVDGGLNFGMTKYDSGGNFKWRDIEDVYDRWDQPRGMAIDQNDYIYQNGNGGTIATGGGCAVRKFDKDGAVIKDEIITPDDDNYFVFCWGSAIDLSNNWFLSSSTSRDGGKLFITKYDSDINLINIFTTIISESSSTSYGPTHTTTDYCGNAYFVLYFLDSNYSNNESVAVVKGKNSYPDTTTETGTLLTLINKNPMPYTTLSDFSVSYGSCDEADARFQISNNRTDWYYWNGSSWVETISYDNNTAEEINAHISQFSQQFGAGEFYFKAYLLTDGTKQVDLASVTITKGGLVNLPDTGANDNMFVFLTIGFLFIFRVLLHTFSFAVKTVAQKSTIGRKS